MIINYNEANYCGVSNMLCQNIILIRRFGKILFPKNSATASGTHSTYLQRLFIYAYPKSKLPGSKCGGDAFTLSSVYQILKVADGHLIRMAF